MDRNDFLRFSNTFYARGAVHPKASSKHFQRNLFVAFFVLTIGNMEESLSEKSLLKLRKKKQFIS